MDRCPRQTNRRIRTGAFALLLCAALALAGCGGASLAPEPPPDLPGAKLPQTSAPALSGNEAPEPPAVAVPYREPEETVPGLGVLDRNARRKIIVIDPGHGGKDVGAEVRRRNGDDIYEKNIDLAIAYRLRYYLEAAGATVYMIREDDRYVYHRARGSIADRAGGDLFLSIHNNSSDVASVHGTETWYYEKVDLYDRTLESRYGISSKGVAEAIHAELVAALGTRDRGVRSTSDLAVLVGGELPAVVIEGAYMSNPGDLSLILSDGYPDRYAFAVAKAVVRVMNEAVK